jgi:hypothetical protein
MKFKIKTEAFYATIFMVASLATIVIIQLYGVRNNWTTAYQGWYPTTVTLFILILLLSYIAK